MVGCLTAVHSGADQLHRSRNWSIAAPALMHSLHCSPAAMGALLSAFFWSYSLLQIPAGYLVDRYGLKWTYTAAFLLWSLASSAIAGCSTFLQVLLLRILLVPPNLW